MSVPPPMLEVRDLSVRYGAIEALHGLSINVAQGQIVTLIGCNGAGKSTTLRSISGLLRPSKGQVMFEGKPISGMAPHQIVRLGIAQAPEGRGIFSNLTVEENLDMGAFARKDHDQIAKDRERALTLFPRVRERLKQNAGTLSGGEQQMLAIGRAMMSRPRLLLLDEPSMGLAPLMVRKIFEVIRSISEQGVTILLVEQNARLALQAASRGYVMESGAITLADSSASLLASAQVRQAYLGE